MKEIKGYIIISVIVVIALLFKLNNWSAQYGNVEAFRGAVLEEDVFFPLIAKSINEEKQLEVICNGEEYNNQFQDLYVNSDKSLLCSLQFAKDVFLASVYSDGEYVLLDFNGEEFKMKSYEANGTYYMSMDEVCKCTGCYYSFDADNTEVVINTKKIKSILPKKYDLRSKYSMPDVMNQGNSSNCWAYASILALETAVLPEKYDFDVDAMINAYDKTTSESSGGAYTNALAYLLAWRGPIEKTSNVIELTGNDVSLVKHVQETRFYDSNDIEDIKWAVYRYGGVSTSIFANISTSNLNKSSYYNNYSNSYCYDGAEKPNHEITIIGWDDNYSASNFSSNVKGDGAFICQNSWGKNFGDNGVFYVSYYDTNIGSQAVCYSRVMPENKFDTIYQSDLCGWKGQLGYGSSKAFGANVFTAKSQEKLEACGFYAIDKNATLNIYVVKNFSDINSLGEKELVASRKYKDAGYYTVEFDKPIKLEKGQKFAVVMEIWMDGVDRPIAIEYKAKESDTNVDVSDGEGYISKDGVSWESVEGKANGNLCLKAYSSNIDE